jgi:signal transduction histidine kinase
MKSAAEMLFAGPGEMRACCRKLDWSSTPLGPVEKWPASLRVIVQLVLAHPLPVVLLWGPELVQIYNDGCRALMGAESSRGLGEGTRAGSPDVWYIDEPSYARVLAGESLSVGDALHYSPVYDESGGVAGVLVTTFEARPDLQETWETDASGLVVANTPIHPDDRPRAEREWRDALEEGRNVDVEIRVKAPEGRYRWINMRASPFVSVDGTIRKWVGMNIDIDARKVAELRVEETLIDNERRNRFLLTLSDRLNAHTDANAIRDSATELLGEYLETSRCHFLEWDFDRGEARLLSEHLRLPGRSMARMTRVDLFAVQLKTLREGRPLVVNDWLEEPLPEGAREQLARVQIRAQVSFPLAKNGKLSAALTVADVNPRKWSDVEIAVIGDAAHRTWAAIERARAEAALRDADRRKDAFIATMSHELRNPLAAVRGAASVLADRAAPDARRADAVGIVQRQAAMMNRLLDDLLDTTRIDLGLLTVEKRIVTVASIIDEALEAVQPVIDAAHHAVSVTVRPRTLAVDADPARLAQVLANLVSNAAKYTEDSGRIAVEAAIEGNDVVIRVVDNGTGLSADDLEGVFEMFSQGGNARERGKGGVGIGLALARRILDLHGGWVRAESEGPGKGSTFSVGLPRIIGDAAIPVPLSEPAPARGGKSTRLLVADDSRDCVEPLVLMLRDRGYDTTMAADGIAALEHAERVHPEIILLDIGMPGLDGYEVAQKIRATDWGAHAYLIALTGWGRSEDKARVREAGFDAHVVKGTDPAKLFAMIDAQAAKTK